MPNVWCHKWTLQLKRSTNQVYNKSARNTTLKQAPFSFSVVLSFGYVSLQHSSNAENDTDPFHVKYLQDTVSAGHARLVINGINGQWNLHQEDGVSLDRLVFESSAQWAGKNEFSFQEFVCALSLRLLRVVHNVFCGSLCRQTPAAGTDWAEPTWQCSNREGKQICATSQNQRFPSPPWFGAVLSQWLPLSGSLFWCNSAVCLRFQHWGQLCLLCSQEPRRTRPCFVSKCLFVENYLTTGYKIPKHQHANTKNHKLQLNRETEAQHNTQTENWALWTEVLTDEESFQASSHSEGDHWDVCENTLRAFLALKLIRALHIT